MKAGTGCTSSIESMVVGGGGGLDRGLSCPRLFPTSHSFGFGFCCPTSACTTELAWGVLGPQFDLDFSQCYLHLTCSFS